MSIEFPLNTHGRHHRKAGTSATTDISAARAVPTLDEWGVVLLTPAEQGVPGFWVDENRKPIPFNNESQARGYFGDGDPVELARFLFNPTPRGNADIRGPSEVFPYRVGSPTQAILNLENLAAADALKLTSKDYGTRVNSIEVKTANPRVAQVATFTVAGTVLVGESWTITINDTDHTTTGHTTVSEVTAALFAAINAGAETALVTAVDNDPDVTVTADVAGQPFSYEVSTDSAGGTIVSANTTANIYAKCTVDFRQGTLTIDGSAVGPMFRMIYTGAGTKASVTITRTSGKAITLTTSVTGGATADSLNIDLRELVTVNDVVARINAADNYRAHMLADADATLLASDLDAEAGTGINVKAIDEVPTTVTANTITFATDIEASGLVGIGDYVRDLPTAALVEIVDIAGNVATADGTPFTPSGSPTLNAAIVPGIEATAILPAIVKQIADENTLVTAEIIEAGNTGNGLAVIAFTRLDDSGLGGTAGTNPTVVVQDWLDAQDDIEKKFKGTGILLLLNTTDRTIHDSFVGFAQDKYDADQGIFPFYSGARRDESNASSQARGPFLNSRFAHIVGIGGSVLDREGASKDVSGVFYAAMYAGQVAGSGLTQPSTMNPIPVTALDRDNTDDNIKSFIQNGITVPEDDPDKGFVFQIAVTTAQSGNRMESITFLDHQRNTVERAVRREVKRLYTGKALTRLVRGSIRETVRQVLGTFLDQGESGEVGFLAAIGSITVEGTPQGLVNITVESDHIDEFDFGNIVHHARISTFVDVGVAEAA